MERSDEMKIIIVLINAILSIFILSIAFKVYNIYRRKYLFWFLISLIIITFIFIYSPIEMLYLNQYAIIFYPVAIILAEITIIMAEKELLTSLKIEKGEEYKFLIREDIALIRAYQKLINHFIRRIAPFIGVKSIENLLDECIEKYPILAGCYIGIDEKLITKAVEENINVIREEGKEKICEAFTYLLSKLIDLHSAFVPYDEIADELRKEIGKIERRLTKYFIYFALFKLVIEPILRKCKAEELKAVRISIDIKGIYINKRGGLEIHQLYYYDDSEKEKKFLNFLHRLSTILGKKEEITNNFRNLPPNIKEEIYKHEFMSKLPKGIMEEEKIALASKEKLIEELVEKKRKLEEAYMRLAEAKLDRMKSRFIDIVAHELKTPLTAIKTYNELLLKEKLGKLNKLQKEKLEKMAKSIERLTNLVDDMLQIPSIDRKELELRKEKFYAKDLFEKMLGEIEEISAEKKQIIETEIDEKATIFGDQKLIEKAIKNILINAVKYTPAGGKIRIRVSRNASFSHIQISDTGKGIRKEELEKIFEPFYTGEGGGVGLGLAIAKNIVESHGGKIWAESMVGKGSTFHIVLRGEK